MTDRFDNIPTADLLAREREARREAEALKEAVRDRLKAECTIEVGAIYRVTAGRFAGRRLWVEGIGAGIPDVMRRGEFEVFAWGRLNGKSAAGDGWTIKRQNVNVQRLVKEGGNA
ncbi:hypothetical protein [Mesorhizobium sp. M2A.F.Ca.ET.039.01.1.1]|uniref:hypothetical protein n=1 Tax=Mesorhizobium sp. M2A.F.Ca.ET.039.01.1.1 TaxID=2496746 RepID=UPI000FCAB66E|nr:hypothetical protein [Mesorhizobium sp. M2A.F.Ca.ET.039.01.1.1]RWX72511.1 hypothetical protein EOA24_00530 [Mesorhizobium sp. M2A.F.Ca.ET.039.01.1.1]